MRLGNDLRDLDENKIYLCPGFGPGLVPGLL